MPVLSQVPEMEPIEEGFQEPYEDSIFMGIELSSIIEEESLPVVQVTRSAVHLENGSGEMISGVGGSYQFKKSIRFSDAWIKLEDFRVFPFSIAGYQALRNMQTAMALEEGQQNLADENIRKEVQLETAPRGTSGGSRTEQDWARLNRASEQTTMSQANLEALSDYTANANTQLGDSGGGFDSLRIAFSYYPARDLADAYVFIIARYDFTEKQKRISANKLALVPLGDLKGGELERFSFLLGGFGNNPQVKNLNLHFFTGREEIPSNYSDQRILVDETQAFDFIYADYVSAFHQKDKEPRLFRKIRLDSNASELKSYQDLEISLKVFPDGSVEPTQVPIDNEAIQERVGAIVANCMFLPAVESDTLVVKEITARLSELVEL